MSACYHKRLSVILSVLYYLFFSGSLIVAEELQIRYALIWLTCLPELKLQQWAMQVLSCQEELLR
jgi:hypothetical protein